MLKLRSRRCWSCDQQPPLIYEEYLETFSAIIGHLSNNSGSLMLLVTRPTTAEAFNIQYS